MTVPLYELSSDRSARLRSNRRRARSVTRHPSRACLCAHVSHICNASVLAFAGGVHGRACCFLTDATRAWEDTRACKQTHARDAQAAHGRAWAQESHTDGRALARAASAIRPDVCASERTRSRSEPHG
eukprot:805912-Pleurochrysis_carterae.AAC.2